jgi:hypothetical protein
MSISHYQLVDISTVLQDIFSKGRGPASYGYKKSGL